MRVKFTDKYLTGLKAKADRFQIVDTEARGLGVVVFPSGVKSYFTFAKFEAPRVKSGILRACKTRPLATSRVARRLPIDRWFYIGMAIRAIIVISSGFAPTATGPIAGSTVRARRGRWRRAQSRRAR